MSLLGIVGYSTTLAVLSGTGLNEAADAAVERSSNFNELAGKTIRQAQSQRRKSL
jgi:hypothetical protein